MAKKSLGYAKLQWTCPNCKTINPGPEKLCLSCGSPQPENVEFEDSMSRELIKDENEIKSAKAGPDIHCPFCGTRNPSTQKICSRCGADLRDREIAPCAGAAPARAAARAGDADRRGRC